MEPGPLADLILDLSKGRHGCAGHPAEDQSGDGDAKHHGHLRASCALSEAARQDCLRDPVQDACRCEHTHDAVHGEHQNYRSHHTADAVCQKSCRGPVLNGDHVAKGEKSGCQADHCAQKDAGCDGLVNVSRLHREHQHHCHRYEHDQGGRVLISGQYLLPSCPCCSASAKGPEQSEGQSGCHKGIFQAGGHASSHIRGSRPVPVLLGSG